MFEVSCSDCKGSSVVKINDTPMGKIIEWLRIGTVISARERLDRNLGWQCYCGNDNLMTDQEKKYITDKSSPDPKEIEQITRDLIIQDDTNFTLKGI